MVSNLEWILPLVVCIGALFDVILVLVYMKHVHPNAAIIFSKEKKETKDSGSDVYT